MLARLSSVNSLSRGVCPSAICRFVVSACINSVNAVLFVRLHSHVGKEVFKRVGPSFTHRNASASVVSVLSIVWVSASLQHCPPTVVLGASPTFSRVVMSGHSFDGNFAAKTTAASCFAVPKLRRHDRLFGAAGAYAVPCSLPSDVCRATNNCKSFKDLPIKPNYIFSSVHWSLSYHFSIPSFCVARIDTPRNSNAITEGKQDAT